MACQLNSDRFQMDRVVGGLQRAQGIEHLRRNIEKNHKQGLAQAAGRQRSRRQGRGRGGRGGRGRRRLQGPALPPDPPPSPAPQPFRVFLAFLYESMFLPSRWMFDAYWRAMKARMVYVWGEPLWVEYVFRVYFHQDAQGRHAANWFCGRASKLQPGHPASQQTAEQMFRLLKRYLAGRYPLPTHMSLACAIESAVRCWSRPVEPHTEVGNKAMHSQLSSRVSLSKPMCPDSWMPGRSGTTLRRPGGRLQYHASIHQIVKKSPAALQLSIQRLDRPQHTFLAMCVGRQTRLPDGLVNRMVSQVTASRLVTSIL